MDTLTPERRSWNMSRIRSRDTTPERLVRSLLHRMGYRFRLHRKDLPGRPDIVLPKYKAVVLVHGCYWHRHEDCRLAYVPKSNQEFWQAKFAETVRRDTIQHAKLAALGWKIIIVWECKAKNQDALAKYLHRELCGVRQGKAQESVVR